MTFLLVDWSVVDLSLLLTYEFDVLQLFRLAGQGPECHPLLSSISRPTEIAVRVQPLPFDRDRSDQWQPLHLRSPLDCKPILADLENDPQADYSSCGRLRKLDDPRYRMQSSVRRHAILGPAPVLGLPASALPPGQIACLFVFSPSAATVPPGVQQGPSPFHRWILRPPALWIC
jgi:hypothetical protein